VWQAEGVHCDIAEWCKFCDCVGRRFIHRLVEYLWSVDNLYVTICCVYSVSLSCQVVWNSSADSLRDPAVGMDSFRHTVKMFLFTKY